jgi:1-deoxy-D-xylulose-5-phosphate reductoisomerase
MVSGKKITVLGATGSIGASTLDLVERNREKFEVVALTANSNAEKLAELAIKHEAEIAVLADPANYEKLKSALAGTDIEATAGEAAMLEACERSADFIMAAIVGVAGLRPTLHALQQGTTIGLANKECLVTAGELFMREVEKTGTTLLPVDSEHSAAFQAIDSSPSDNIERIILTASGGPFRTWSVSEISRAGPAQALKHPNWSMGRKISIDSATLMNKGLELIEAYHLFPIKVDQLDVVIHPQSIVHCLVEYQDGSVLAQMSSPDMRTPIAYALAWPERMAAPTKRLNLPELATMTFEEPDLNRFPALKLAMQAMQEGTAATAILNAANEVAVEAFLDGNIGFPAIVDICRKVMEQVLANPAIDKPNTLGEVLELDLMARKLAKSESKK